MGDNNSPCSVEKDHLNIRPEVMKEEIKLIDTEASIIKQSSDKILHLKKDIDSVDASKGIEQEVATSVGVCLSIERQENKLSPPTSENIILDKNTLNFKCIVKLPDISRQRQHRKHVKNILEIIKKRDSKAEIKSANNFDRLGINDKNVNAFSKGSSKFKLREEEFKKRKEEEDKKKEERHAEKQ